MFRGATAVNLDSKGRVAIQLAIALKFLKRTKGKWFVL